MIPHVICLCDNVCIRVCVCACARVCMCVWRQIVADIYEPQGIAFVDATATFLTNELLSLVEKTVTDTKVKRFLSIFRLKEQICKLWPEFEFKTFTLIKTALSLSWAQLHHLAHWPTELLAGQT